MIDPNGTEFVSVLRQVAPRIAALHVDLLDPKLKMLMHPYDVKTPPTGEGWIIQIVCHHYNPYPTSREQIALPSTDPRRTDFGPVWRTRRGR